MRTAWHSELIVQKIVKRGLPSVSLSHQTMHFISVGVLVASAMQGQGRSQWRQCLIGSFKTGKWDKNL